MVRAYLPSTKLVILGTSAIWSTMPRKAWILAAFGWLLALSTEITRWAWVCTNCSAPASRGAWARAAAGARAFSGAATPRTRAAAAAAWRIGWGVRRLMVSPDWMGEAGFRTSGDGVKVTAGPALAPG